METDTDASVWGCQANPTIPKPTEPTPEASVWECWTDRTIPIPSQTTQITSIRECQADHSIPMPMQTAPHTSVWEYRADRTIPEPTRHMPPESVADVVSQYMAIIAVESNGPMEQCADCWCHGLVWAVRSLARSGTVGVHIHLHPLPRSQPWPSRAREGRDLMIPWRLAQMANDQAQKGKKGRKTGLPVLCAIDQPGCKKEEDPLSVTWTSSGSSFGLG